MRPFTFHILILVVLLVLGAVLFTGEALSPESSWGLIRRYTFTRLYFLALIGYAFISTFIVLCVRGFYGLRSKVFTRTAVILSHVIPVGLVWIAVELGIHDYIQNRTGESAQGARRDQSQIRNTPSAGENFPSAPVAIGKVHEYGESVIPVQTEEWKDD